MDTPLVDLYFGQAAEGGDVDAMRELLAQGADVNSRNGSPLESAVLKDRTAAVQYLLDNGARVNVRRVEEDTPLHWAAYNANSEIMGLLLAAGADVHAPTEYGKTPLYVLAMGSPLRRGNLKKCAELLISHGARIDDVNRNTSRTPLQCAIYFGRRELIKIFLRAGAREIATADLPPRYDPFNESAFAPSTPNESAFEVVDAIRAAGGWWPEYVAKHRRLLAGIVSKLSPTKSESPRPIPLDAASHLVGFWCPPGGY